MRRIRAKSPKGSHSNKKSKNGGKVGCRDLLCGSLFWWGISNNEVRAKKHVDEIVAVNQIVRLLDSDEIRARFDEYDMRASAESRLVKALDVLDTAVQHLCAQDLAYVGGFADNFYWKMFFSPDFAAFFDFEPVMRGVFDEIKQRVARRLKDELNIDAGDFVK